MSAGPSTLPPSQAPSTLEYGGDEISALVLDPGQCWTRAGFAGEDTPKSVIPSHYGYIDGAGPDGGRKLYFGDNDVHAVRAGMEIANPMSDGIVADWDTAPSLWRYALTSRLAQDLSEHPLLVTEPIWNPTKNREKTIEVAFEDFDVPAFYLARNAVCAGFAFGKSTALILDVGAANIAVTPVHDGYVLKKGCQRQPIGGDFLSNQIRTHLANMGISITPHYQVLSKIPVDVGKPAEATLKTWPEGQAPTESFRRFEEERVLTEFKECCAQAWPGPGPLPAIMPEGGVPNVAATRSFEFPDGYNMLFGLERFRMTEGIFTPRSMLASANIPHPYPEHTLGLKDMVFAAMKDVDVDIKQIILNSVVVTGAGSLLYQFNERALHELGIAFPGPRVKMLASQIPVERRYATWLGGSILASLGSFHQLWISKKEYEEHGANIVEKRCK